MTSTNQPLNVSSPASSHRHRFCHDAMATTFEIYMDYPDGARARQAAGAAFAELDSIEAELSRFIPGSDISRLNAAAGGNDVRISTITYSCLEQAINLSEITNHTFDINIGRLLEIQPDNTGTDSWRPFNECMTLSQDGFSVHLRHPVALDLGGIGKGFALDGMADILHQWHIEKALLHSGSSTVRILNNDPNYNWPVTLSHPLKPSETITTLHLTSGALACSGNHLRPHIINPAQAAPAAAPKVVWLTAPTAAAADALATALVVMTICDINAFFVKHPDNGVITLTINQDGYVKMNSNGI